MSRPTNRRTVRHALLYPLLAAAMIATVGPMTGLYAQDQDKPAEQEADKQADKQAEKQAKQPTLTETLGGDDRYLTHVSTDKPIYRIGETVYVRGTVLHAFTNKPFEDNKAEIEAIDKEIVERGKAENDDARQEMRDLYQKRAMLQQQSRLSPMVEIKDPKGATVASGRSDVQDSVIGFKWEVPDGQAGGEYTIKVSFPWSGLAPAERTFDIRAYRAPRIRSQIQFLKDGYGPGDTVVATIEATRAEGGVPEGAKVTAIARVDGEEVARVETTMSAAGTAEARFELPKTIERGEGSLAFVIEDGGVVESASKTLPILLQTVDLSIYPEGGDLVAGVENRVYFEARTPYGKPADINGSVVKIGGDPNGIAQNLVVRFETTHEGRGVFTFTPLPDTKYILRINDPSSVKQTFELPKAITRGAVIKPLPGKVVEHESVLGRQTTEHIDGVYGFAEPLQFHVFTPGLEAVSLQLRQREQVVWEKTVEGMIKGRAENSASFGDIVLADTATGILTVTAYDAEGNPLAERLIYRAPKNQVNIEILPDSAQYTPSGHVRLTIKTTDENGKPVSSVAGLTVTDDAVLEMIETREQAPSLPAMVLLEPEVKELADAHVYLDPNNPDAAQQLDLLLGTQGWRRFALVNVSDFIREHGDDARRLLAMRVPVQHEIARLRNNAPADLAFAAGAVDEAEDGAAREEAVEQEKAVDDPKQVEVDNPNADPAPEPQPDAKPQPAPNDVEEALNDAAEEQEAKQLIREDRDIAGDFALRRMPEMVFIREYAHKQPAGKPFGQRSDFTETVYWSSVTKTDANGMATVEFDLSDSVTSFRVKADAFTKDGALGTNSSLIESVRPFYVEPKLPLELTAGDKVLLPIAMINNTNKELPVTLMISRLGKAGNDELDAITLGADTRGRAIHELLIGNTFGEVAFDIEARAGQLYDQNKRKLRIVPAGFPIDDGSGGMLQPDGEASDTITIPETIVPGSLSASVTVYPTPMANLTEALEALIRDPYGCFEQTSSTTFPLVMAQQYFMTHQGIDPQLIAKSKEKLDAGYKRLIGFETEKDGFEWFGSTPPHEALTAYGLLQFNEMKDVMDVDQKMIDRTAEWLFSRMDEDGSFKLDPKQLDSFGGAPQDTTNAYIVYSMLEAGHDPAKIQKSIDLVLKQAMEGNDAYIVALGANIALKVAEHHEMATHIHTDLGDREDRAAELRDQYKATARGLMDRLADMLNDEGFVDGAVTSITRSGGDALKIETTSLAILAWLRDDTYTPQVEKSMLWLTERCKAGRFGSTQSTVLALKAIVEYDKARSTPKAPGELILLVDGKPVGESVAFDKETKGAIYLPDIAGKLTPGEHTIAVLMDGGSKMPYSIAVKYHAKTPASSDECKLRIETVFPAGVRTSNPSSHLRSTTVAEGETTEVNVRVTNITKDGLPTPIAIVGLPGGLEPDYDQLKELVTAGKIAAFEVIGRDVVLYWREMKPEQVVELPIRCTAAVPGTYTGPASRTYLYYTDEHKQWADGLTVNITPRKAD